MEASRESDGAVTLRLSEDEAVVLHAAIATAEFENELDAIELREPVERKVLSDVQQSLSVLIPGLGTDEYGSTVERSYAAIDPRPY